MCRREMQEFFGCELPGTSVFDVPRDKFLKELAKAAEPLKVLFNPGLQTDPSSLSKQEIPAETTSQPTLSGGIQQKAGILPEAVR